MKNMIAAKLAAIAEATIEGATPLVKLAVLGIIGIPAILHALIAEITPDSAPPWLGSATQISSFGLVAWIVFHVFSKAMPAQQAAASVQADKQREAHLEAMKQLTETFEKSLQAQRTDLLALRIVCKADERIK